MKNKLFSHGENIANDTQQKLENAAEDLGRKARKMFDDHSFISQGADTITTAICEKPVKSMVIALGIGILLGKIIRRS
jgi:ElaB/YqjD/DUF883 family membrane-anchored ribosome-binding protein